MIFWIREKKKGKGFGVRGIVEVGYNVKKMIL